MTIDRRQFLLRAGAAGLAATAGLPERLLAEPYAPWSRATSGRPVRVTGRVTGDERGLAGVAVTDGLAMTITDTEGRYSLVADSSQPFVYLSLPAGWRVPQTAHGTARFHVPLRADAFGEASAQFALVRDRRGDDRHAFLLLADPQTQTREETGFLHAQTVPALERTVATLGDQPIFGVGCGDIMYDDLTLYPEYERAVSRTGVPFFQVVGNHDLLFDARTDEGTTATFERHFGPRYYSFDRGEMHYVVLDDVLWYGTGYVGYLDQPQLAWLAQDLSRLARGRTVVVFTHIPALSNLSTRASRPGTRRDASESVNNREGLYRLLEPYRAYILSGHTHEHEIFTDGGATHIVHGTVCGAWWSGPICHDGTPNGYGVYEVRGSELRWHYQSTGFDATHQIRAYAPRAVDGRREFTANVWGWDPSWSVVWLEGADRRGAMTRRLGKDPLSVELHAGSDKPARRKWVEPAPTEHLFHAVVADGARELRVEARDRFGRTYSAPVPER